MSFPGGFPLCLQYMVSYSATFDTLAALTSFTLLAWLAKLATLAAPEQLVAEECGNGRLVIEERVFCS